MHVWDGGFWATIGAACVLLGSKYHQTACHQRYITIMINVHFTEDLLQFSLILFCSLSPIKSLYTNIPQGTGIKMVLQRIVNTNPPTSRANDYKNFLRDSLKTIIKNNHFSFGEDFFRQTRGVAMGTKCAPPFANLFMASLKERALGTWKGPVPTAWLRFLDDVLMLWNGGLEQLERFLSHLNGQMSTIKFTLEHSQNSAVFLDLHIYKGDRFRSTGILDTKIHTKAINPQSFLHFTSCHPQHIFSNIIRGEVLRTLRCSSDQQAFSVAKG